MTVLFSAFTIYIPGADIRMYEAFDSKRNASLYHEVRGKKISK